MSSGEPFTQVHLLVCVHGMWGQPSHFARFAEIVRETYGGANESGVEMDVLVAETNREENTYDGIDWGAERVIEEIKARVAVIETSPPGSRSRKVTRFSMVGYSLGGLVSRYVVGVFHATSFFDSVEPVNFATIATPHLGLPRYKSIWSGVAHTLGPLLLSRTGRQFYARDKEEWGGKGGKRALVEVMSEKDGVFYEGLSRFKNITFVGNAIDDVLVPFVAACIEAYDPFIGHAESGIEIELDERYPPMIKSFKYPATRPSLPKKQSFLSLKGFRAWWNAPSTLPPALQVRFPLNLLVFLFLPIIIPLMILIIIGRFMWKSFKSKKRIRMLEKNDAGNRSAIVKFVSSLGHTVEDAVVEMMEDETAQNVSPGDVEKTPHPTTPPTTSKAPPPTFTYPPIHAPSNPVPSAVQPILTPTQLRIIENLNQLPRLKKGFVWLDGLTNTHATIMCRDINEFEFHRRGEGVLRWLVDGFEV